jgi:hypothetical protein
MTSLALPLYSESEGNAVSIVTSKTSSAGTLYEAPLCAPEDATVEQDDRRPFITVVFTTTQATLAALKHARELVHGMGEEIRILVPQVVPYALPLNHPAADPAFRIRPLRKAAAQGTVDMRIDVLLCRDPRLAVPQALRPHSVVLIGSRNHRWWPARESSLKRVLRRAGHHVITVNQD